MLESLSDLFLKIFEKTGYIGLFLASFVESLFAPIPSEIVMITAGYYAKSSGGFGELILLVIVASFGNFFGTLPLYLGARYGRELFMRTFIDKWGRFLLISRKDIEKVEKFFGKYGNITIFIAKLIPGIRSVIAIPAGLGNVNFKLYFSYSMLGSVIWNMILATIGFFAYEKRETIFHVLKPVEKFVLLVVALAIIIYCYKVVAEFIKINKDKSKSSNITDGKQKS